MLHCLMLKLGILISVLSIKNSVEDQLKQSKYDCFGAIVKYLRLSWGAKYLFGLLNKLSVKVLFTLCTLCQVFVYQVCITVSTL